MPVLEVKVGQLSVAEICESLFLDELESYLGERGYPLPEPTVVGVMITDANSLFRSCYYNGRVCTAKELADNVGSKYVEGLEQSERTKEAWKKSQKTRVEKYYGQSY